MVNLPQGQLDRFQVSLPVGVSSYAAGTQTCLFRGEHPLPRELQCGLMRACLPAESLALNREGLVPTQLPLLQCALVFSAYQLLNMLI